MAIDPKNLAGTASLTFSDEFNTFSIWNGSSGTWQTSYPWSPASGGTNAPNGELQWYINPAYAPTSSVNPFSISGGILDIEAAPASATIKSITGLPYTSGIITTNHSFAQTYGYFEMRAQLPTGQGIWPAFWLLPTDLSWPPEIDVMEVIGSRPNELNTTVHYGNELSKGFVTTVSGMTNGYHTYGVDWQKDYITWFFDGAQVAKTATPAGLDKPMYMLANLAVGGSWPGSPDSSTPFPSELKIDYIRAYAAAPNGGGTPPPSPTPTPTPTPTTQKLFELAVGPATTKTILGTSGKDVINGTSGNDYIDSWGGSDTMSGGAGGDTYEIYSSSAVIKELLNAGIDTAISGAKSFTLAANVENLILFGNGGVAGNGTQTGTGNSLNNLMISNSTTSAFTLKGMGGNDQIFAGKAADILTGGTGADEFVFKALPTAAGRVTDFAVGVDMLDLRGIFAASGYAGANPIIDKHLMLSANASGGTDVFFDADGTGAKAAVKVVSLDGIVPSTLHLQADIWFA